MLCPSISPLVGCPHTSTQSEEQRTSYKRPESVESDPDVWTGCVSQESCAWIAEVADMYPACLIGSRAVALMGIRTHLWSH